MRRGSAAKASRPAEELPRRRPHDAPLHTVQQIADPLVPHARASALRCAMDVAGNPAGQLHGLLRQFEIESSDSVSVAEVWKSVLHVEDDQLPSALGAASALLPQIDAAVRATGSADLASAYTTFGAAWARAIFTPDRAHAQGSAGLVDGQALSALSVLSFALASTLPSGASPSRATLNEFRGRLEDAAAQVAASDELPQVVRNLILRRLSDIVWSLDHYDIVGFGGVEAAVERLAGAVVTRSSQEQRRTSTVKTVLFALGTFYSMFLTGPEAIEAAKVWVESAEQVVEIVESRSLSSGTLEEEDGGGFVDMIDEGDHEP